MRTLQDYRAYVFSYLDLTEEDTPTALIDSWVLEGYRRIIHVIRRWPFFEMSTVVTTAPGQRNYPLPENMVDVRKVDATFGVLSYVDHAEAVDKFHLFSGVSAHGQARAYSIWEGELQVWPLPTGPETLTLYGYRAPSDWMAGGAGALPDFPERFEDALLSWVLYRAHLHQDDPELAAIDKAEFQEALDVVVASEIEPPSGFPMVLASGGVERFGLPSRLAYPWE